MACTELTFNITQILLYQLTTVITRSLSLIHQVLFKLTMLFKHLLTLTITIHILFQPTMSSNPLCDTSYQCSSSVVSCVEGEDCFVDCTSYRSCYNATIECPSNSHNCRIYCADHDACMYATINSSSSNGNLTLVGGWGDWQFSLTKIHCPNGGS
eukprot:229322_1